MKEHQYERRVRMLRERIDANIERMKQWVEVDGRPMFFKQLSPREELKLYANPQTRMLLERDKIATEGQEAFILWKARMEQKMLSLLKEEPNGSSGLAGPVQSG